MVAVLRDAIQETITTKTKGQLVYTLDGSDPRESATARRTNPLKVKIDPTSREGRALSPG